MSHILTPVVFLLLFTLGALVRIWWKQKEGRRRLLWVAVPVILLTVLHSHTAGYYAIGSLEADYPPADDVPSEAGAIVVLAGAVSGPDRVRTKVELGPSTLSRCVHAAELHRKVPDRLVLVSGGPVEDGDGTTAAKAMRDFLIGHGVPAEKVLEEGQSLNTHENAIESARLLRERGIRRVVLVTHAVHMKRATACFQAQGIEVKPSPCGHSATGYHFVPTDLLPDARSIDQVDQAWHEWMGLAVYRFRGWI